MSLTPAQAADIVAYTDTLFRPRPEDATNPQRKAALTQELLMAFADQDVRPLDVQSFVLQWRRPWDESEEERIRTQTRPTAWDLLRLRQQSRHQQQAKTPARGCQECFDAGHRVVTAALWRHGLLRIQNLVVCCDCGQGNTAMLDGQRASERLSWWRDKVREGAARFQGDVVALVVDVSPVYGSVVLEALVGLAPGELVDSDLLAEVEMAIARYSS